MRSLDPPSARECRGSNALVFDAYGFSPRAAIDGDEQREYREVWRASGVTCFFQNAGQEGQDPMRLIKRLVRITSATDRLRHLVSKAVAPDYVGLAKKEGKHCLYLTGSRVPLTRPMDFDP